MRERTEKRFILHYLHQSSKICERYKDYAVISTLMTPLHTQTVRKPGKCHLLWVPGSLVPQFKNQGNIHGPIVTHRNDGWSPSFGRQNFLSHHHVFSGSKGSIFGLQSLGMSARTLRSASSGKSRNLVQRSILYLVVTHLPSADNPAPTKSQNTGGRAQIRKQARVLSCTMHASLLLW